MAFSFGIASDLNADISTVSFLGTILFLIVFDFFTGLLEYSVQESHIYTKVVHKIYKELMAMGFVSFTLAMYQASNPPKAAQSWITVLDFVGYVIFFVAIFFVVHALYIMAVSIYSGKAYAKFHVMTISEMLQQLSDATGHWYWNVLFKLRYLPFSYVRTKTEFKIIYILFRDTYWLPNDFNYGSYVAQCLARYSMQMVNISTTSWAVMATLCLLNYARLKLGGEYLWNCVDTDGVQRYDGSCSRVHTELFLVCAGLVVIYMAVLYFVGRVYELRLLARAGVTDIDDYETFLIMEENTLLKVDKKRNVEIQVPEASASGKRGRRRMSITTFRKNIDNLRTELPKKNDEHKLYRQISSMAEPISNFKHQIEDAEIWRSMSSASSKLYNKITGKVGRDKSVMGERGLIFGTDDTESDLTGEVPVPVPVPRIPIGSARVSGSKRQRRSSLTLTLSGGPGIQKDTEERADISDRSITPTSPTRMMKEQQSLTTIEKFMSHKMDKGKSKRKMSDQELLGMKLQEDFSDIYLFSSPQLYFKTVEVGILLNSLYLAMWVCNFITVVDLEYHESVLWQCAMLLPLVLVMPCIGPIVKVASMLSAIATLDLDVIGAVLEESEDIKILTTELREKVQARIQGRIDDQRNIILALFYEIDSDTSGSIDKLEFRDLLRALHLHYSDSKFERLYRAVDRDKNGTLSLEELEFILLPEDAEAREKKMRADIVKNQIARYKEKEKNASPGLIRSSSKFSFLRSSSIDKNDDSESDRKTPPARLSKMRSESRMSLMGLPFQPFSRGVAKTVPSNYIATSNSDEKNEPIERSLQEDNSSERSSGSLREFPSRLSSRSRLPSVIESSGAYETDNMQHNRANSRGSSVSGFSSKEDDDKLSSCSESESEPVKDFNIASVTQEHQKRSEVLTFAAENDESDGDGKLVDGVTSTTDVIAPFSASQSRHTTDLRHESSIQLGRLDSSEVFRFDEDKDDATVASHDDVAPATQSNERKVSMRQYRYYTDES